MRKGRSEDLESNLASDRKWQRRWIVRLKNRVPFKGGKMVSEKAHLADVIFTILNDAYELCSNPIWLIHQYFLNLQT